MEWISSSQKMSKESILSEIAPKINELQNDYNVHNDSDWLTLSVSISVSIPSLTPCTIS